MNIITLTKDNFDDIVDQHDLLVIDFAAKWCAPCKAFAKVIEEVAKQYSEFVFATVDIDDEKELAEEFNIRSVPSVMILRDKVVVYAESGALGASSLKDLLDQTKSIDPADLESSSSSS